MDVQISKWGNSLGIRIPKAFAETLGLDENTSANLQIEGNRLILEPFATSNYAEFKQLGEKYNLAEMLAELEKIPEDERDYDEEWENMPALGHERFWGQHDTEEKE